MSLQSTLTFILKHPMNQGLPIRALSRFARWQVQSRLSDDVEFPWIGGSKLIAKKGMTGATGNIYCGLHEYVDMSFLLHFLREGDLFLDVGANIGSYTILAASVCRAETLTIEPDPKTASYLAKNIAANGVEGLCNIAQTAVGRDEGEISFTVGKDTVNQVQSNAEEPSQVVALTRLDSLLAGKTPILMKMDIEGYELAALEGADNVLSNPVLNAIIIERKGPRVTAILKRYGFERYSYDPVSRALSEGITGLESNNGIFIKDVAAAAARLEGAPRRTYRNQIV